MNGASMAGCRGATREGINTTMAGLLPEHIGNGKRGTYTRQNWASTTEETPIRTTGPRKGREKERKRGSYAQQGKREGAHTHDSGSELPVRGLPFHSREVLRNVHDASVLPLCVVQCRVCVCVCVCVRACVCLHLGERVFLCVRVHVCASLFCPYVRARVCGCCIRCRHGVTAVERARKHRPAETKSWEFSQTEV